MYSVNQLTGFGARQSAAAGVSLAYLGTTTGDGTGSTSEAVTFDFTTGVAGSKITVVIMHSNHTAGYDPMLTCTIDGQTGVKAVEVSVGSQEGVEIWYFDDSSGLVAGSSTVTCTFATAQAIQGAYAYRTTGLVSGAPTVTNTDVSSSTVATLNVNTTIDSITIGGIIQRNSSDSTVAWVGLTEDDEGYVSGNHNHSAASLLAASASTPLTITSTLTAGNRNVAGVSAGWDAA